MMVMFLLLLCLLGPPGCYGAEDIPQDLMVLAGPLTQSPIKDLQFSPSSSQDVFDCSQALPSEIKQHFLYLQSLGVTHFKVPLSWSRILPTGDPSQPHQDTVRCYRTLLEQLTESGLQPLVVLHHSAVPQDIRDIFGDWDSAHLPEIFKQYAEFVFSQFGDLVKAWITFSHVDELQQLSVLEGALNAHDRVHKLLTSVKGDPVSFGAAVDFFLSRTVNMKNVDFVTVLTDYDCSSQTNLEAKLRHIQDLEKERHKLPILIYDMEVKNCASVDLPISTVLKVLNDKDLQILGYEIHSFWGNTKVKYSRSSHGSVSPYEKVLQKFSTQTPAERDEFFLASFPEGFQWAVSSASFKVEGGWAEDGKGETIWDQFGHQGHVLDKQTADLACDSYNKVDYDVYLLRGLNINIYQFSISWARIFPSGLRESLSEKGALYYDKLINTLLQSGIEPVVTLYHWDLPQALQDKGGWESPTIVGAFKDFADYCFSRYGDRVKTWNTFSSPQVVSHSGYGTGEHAPGLKDPVVASYQVTHNILKSHAEAWHTYNDNYRKQQGGKVGIALNADWAEPLDTTTGSVEAANRYMDFMLGWFAHPIFVNGDYPDRLKSQVELKKIECQPTEVARLPVFTDAEKQRIKGTADFFGLNHYTTRLVNDNMEGCVPGPHGVGDFQSRVDPTWPSTASDSIHLVPWGLRRLLNYVSTEYTSVSGLPIHITGSGIPTAYSGEVFNDIQRIEFLRDYINEALKAILQDGISVNTFTVQSLTDGFEGPQGYSERYGLHYVNFEDQNRQRTPKQSAYFYSELINNNGFIGRQTDVPGQAIYKNTQIINKRPYLPPSEVPSTSKVVWEKFSHQSIFQRKLYHYGTFPDGFQWGVSSSAYQIEGAWNTDGKGPSVWDTFTQQPGNIPNNDNGNVACDSYNKVEDDLYMLRTLKVKSYRFSLSWSRIFPDGTTSSLNTKGVEYYNSLINGLLANNIAPIVTLYHWDLPQALQDNGGWNDANMINTFNDFCDYCFSTFGDRVKFWITFNQPYTIAWSGYGLGQIPPNIKDPGQAPYDIAHNLLKAHARVYHTYDANYRPTQHGLVSISLNAEWVEPKDPNAPREVDTADRALQFQLGWFAHPIFKNGDYPEAMKWQVSNKSELQGLAQSRLPTFTDEEKASIQGTADVFCINSYTTKIVRYVTTPLTPPSYETDQDLGKEEEPNSPTTAIQGQRAVPWGLRRLLNWIKEEYAGPDIYITENGIASDRGITVDDTDRVFFLKTYIDEVLKAHDLDGVKVKGYSIHSLMDSFEWLNGYNLGFGLHHVDFSDPLRPRTPKRSAHYYSQIIMDNGFPETEVERKLYGHFREGFAWSTSTAAYQVEGAWKSDGKGLSIWDQFSHLPGKILNYDNGDVACNSYNKYLEDVERLKSLKVTHYRMSISWPRVLPDGTTQNINEAGLNFYHRLIDALLAANIQPQVTLYHWDLPQALQDRGGWENDSIVQWFKDYADVMFSRLGDKVKFWITFNEPYITANLGYGYGVFAPGISDRPGTGPYIATHNIIKAHAEAWHLYNEKYRPQQGGIISITINYDWAYPRNPAKQEDIDAVDRYLQFFLGWFAHPIFKGDYSEVMKKAVYDRSLAQGLTKSRLPEFTPAEIQRINGTHDYFGVNYYTSVLIFPVNYPTEEQSYDADRGTASIKDWSWLESGSAWLNIVPDGFRSYLRFIKNNYGNPPIYVTENGISEQGPVDLNDTHRIHCYENHINQALKAYLIDGVDLRGYTAWSLMDNFEWGSGYAERFGLFYVNRSDPSLPRIPKESTKYYSTVIRCNGFPDPALGPHECLTPESGGTTTSPPTTVPSAVQFLGMNVSLPDATVALNALFSLTIIGAVAAALMTYKCISATKRSKESAVENVPLENRL